MTEGQKQTLKRQLWSIANELRGKMDADEFRDYILGFVFYKYLSEKQHIYANTLLETETVKNYCEVSDKEDIDAIREESLLKLGYFLSPKELFSAITAKGNANLEEAKQLHPRRPAGDSQQHVEQSTMGTESEDDFNKLFEDSGSWQVLN